MFQAHVLSYSTNFYNNSPCTTVCVHFTTTHNPINKCSACVNQNSQSDLYSASSKQQSNNLQKQQTLSSRRVDRTTPIHLQMEKHSDAYLRLSYVLQLVLMQYSMVCVLVYASGTCTRTLYFWFLYNILCFSKQLESIEFNANDMIRIKRWITGKVRTVQKYI